MAHRVSYQLFVGPIPEGDTIDHKCEHKLCVLHTHLQTRKKHGARRRERDSMTNDEICNDILRKWGVKDKEWVSPAIAKLAGLIVLGLDQAFNDGLKKQFEIDRQRAKAQEPKSPESE
jgi:HNH endonuclease